MLHDKNTLALVKPFTSKDDLRPAMKCVNYDSEYICCTDGEALIRVPNDTGVTGLYDLNGNAKDERFPDFRNVIRLDSPIKYTFSDVPELIKVLTALKNFHTFEMVAFQFGSHGCNILAESDTFSGEGKACLGGTAVEPFTIGFKASNLIKALKAYQTTHGTKTHVTFNMQAPNRALQIETSSLFLLVMPMMLAAHYEQ